MSERLAKSAGLIGAATLASRVLGLVRDAVQGHFFGTGLENDAFVVATRIPTLLRDLFAEGAMSAAFVPTLTRYLKQGGKDAAWRLGSQVVNGLMLVTGALVLFGIVFFWQMPHFLAIAWLHREDYARAGIPLLPVVEPDGRRTGQQALAYAAVLWPVSLLPAVVGIAGAPYLIVATVLGFGLITLSARFARERTAKTARTLFIYSITYLPLLWGALVVDRIWLS